MKAEWNESYIAGVEVFDENHKKLFALLSKLQHCDEGSQESDEVISKTLKELREYTNDHFPQEEKVLEENNYNGIEQQKKDHAYFISKIKDYGCMYLGGSKPQLTDIIKFLNEWIQEHILDCDYRFTCFLKEKKVS